MSSRKCVGTRAALVSYLEARRIATRLLFGGNLMRQPAYLDVTHRHIGDLANSDFVMRQVLWIGLYPGLSDEMIDESLKTSNIRPAERAVQHRRGLHRRDPVRREARIT